MIPAHLRSLLAFHAILLAGCLPALPPDAVDDADGDGVGVADDCDDGDPEVGAGAPWYADADQDSYGDPDAPTDVVCPGDTVAGNYVADGTDCNDHDATIHPSANEVCDAEDVDEDCTGLADDADPGVDAGGFTTFYADEDGDAYGDAASPMLQCDPGDAVTDDQDCDDQDASVHPGATEDDCADPVDYNCDDSVQFEDFDGDGVAACLDCNDADPAIHPAADELCDGVDNNCVDGTDESTALDASTWYQDADSDAFGDATHTQRACAAPEGFVSYASDCDDADATTFPLAPERCDGTDHDCDTLVNEDDSVDAQSWYPDGDTDGYGVGDPTVQCTAPASTAPYDGDCDDGDSDYHPNAAEGDCTDPNDYNCDGSTGYADEDGDSWPACIECDDANAANFPGADELCDETDNNCDTVVDESTAIDAGTWFADSDSDGYGDPDASELSCAQPGGHVANDTDCDDSAGDVWPGAPEYCGSVDHDCDGATDETASVDALTWYWDADNDTFGDVAVSTVACLAPDGEYVLEGTDCDDGDAMINVSAAEVEGDGIDQDCDGRDLRAESDYTTSFGGQMIIVPAGTFTMGGGAGDPDRTYTDHEVTLTHDFWIGKSEVTQAQWQGWAAAPTANAACVDCPAEVSWVHAVLYANALSAAEGLTECYVADGTALDGAYLADPYSCAGYRLPTEAEWEYASRAGEDTEYSGSDVVADVAWYSGNSGALAHAACALAPNAWWLCDMSGNVWEWTNDHLSITYGGYGDGTAQEDPPGPTSDLAADSDGNPARVVRGGDAQNGSTLTRVAFRGYHPDWSRSDIVGFRLVRSVPSPAPFGQDPSASGLVWSGGSAGTFIGDPDADGFDDIAVSSADTTWVLRGATLASAPAADAADAVWTCASGVSVVTSADLNGDGSDELIMGSMNANSGLGAVYAYSDPFAGGDCLTDADGTMAGDSSFFYWGFGGMAGPLDLDDDGVQDMLIGSNYEGGRVTLVPAASLLGTTTAGVSAAAWWSGGWSGYPYDEVGSANAVAALGDLDGDGVDDAAIGAGGEGGNLGRAYVILGDASWVGGFDTDEASVALDPGDDGQFGHSLTGPGDMNGDGYADLAVGGRNVDTTYLYAGSTLGPVAQAEVYGGGIFGWPLSAPGDLDGDGRPDLLISAIGDDTVGTDAGQVWLLLGSAAWNTAVSASWLGQGAGDSLQSRGHGGDSDGDGQREFLLGGHGSTPYVYLIEEPGL